MYTVDKTWRQYTRPSANNRRPTTVTCWSHSAQLCVQHDGRVGVTLHVTWVHRRYYITSSCVKRRRIFTLSSRSRSVTWCVTMCGWLCLSVHALKGKMAWAINTGLGTHILYGGTLACTDSKIRSKVKVTWLLDSLPAWVCMSIWLLRLLVDCGSDGRTISSGQVQLGRSAGS